MEPADRAEGIVCVLEEADGGDACGSGDGARGGIFVGDATDR
jgi:hypothetical protein